MTETTPELPATPSATPATPAPSATPATAAPSAAGPYPGAFVPPYGAVPAAAPASALPPFVAPASPWATPTSAPSASPAAAPRRTGRTVAAVLAAALLAGTAGGVAGASLAAEPGTGSSLTASTTRVSTGSALTGVERVAETVLPSVVHISATTAQGGGTGSGIVLSSDGVILTNNHVVAGVADGGELTVTFHDGRTVPATIVGRDPGADVAVIRAEGVTDAVAVEIGRSADLAVGQQVVAIGSPLGLQGTVTTGIVSALDRPVVSGDGSGETSVLNAIQTDAPINPGNSGGALVDMDGRLIGINSAIATLGAASGGQSGSIGLGFAIPVDQARWIAEQILDTGTSSRAVLGVSGDDAPEGGAVITSVAEGSAAAEAGLREGDVVTRIGDTRIDGIEKLMATVRSSMPGSTVDVVVVRDGSTETVSVTLGTAGVEL
jgi:putative serine protease PepD